MATVLVSEVTFESPHLASEPLPVRVTLDNEEWQGPAGFADDQLGGLIGENPAVCGGDIVNDGHLTDVSLIIRRSGTVVWSNTKEVCVPVERPSEGLTGMKSIEFAPQPPAGEFTVVATAKVKGDGHPVDTSAPSSLTVQPREDDGGTGDWGDDNEGGTDGGDGGGDSTGDGSGLIDEIFNPSSGSGSGSLDRVVLLGALLAIAWLASSAADVTEAIS